jgi:folate-dependent phosphoribosylglycinamide formyltransferase PurN
MTEQVADDPSSKTGTTASDHPAHNQGEPKGDKVHFLHHKASPGPVIPNEGINVQQEGTREERQRRMEEMNK